MMNSVKRLFQRKQLLFLVSLLGILFVSPLQGVFVNLLLSVSMFAAVYGISYDRKKAKLMLVLGTITFLATWLDVVRDNDSLTFVVVLLWLLFFVTIAIILLEHTLRAENVDSDVIIGAISVYMVTGIIWAFIYSLLAMLDPNAFSYSAGVFKPPYVFTNFTYYSYVTLTTLGYGDITPVGAYARIISYLEAIAGVMYIAILVSRFVSMYGRSRTS